MVDQMTKLEYSLINGESNDSDLKKMNRTCGMIFDVKGSNKVELQFYETEVLLKFSEK